jgi:hypothetical protein
MPTDPPYLVNYQGGNHPQSWHNSPAVKDTHWDDYQDGEGAAFFTAFLRVTLAEALTPNPACYQFHASSRQALVEQAWQANGLLVHQQLIWVKSRAVLTHSHYLWQHEPCFYGWVQGKQPSRKPPESCHHRLVHRPAGGEQRTASHPEAGRIDPADGGGPHRTRGGGLRTLRRQWYRPGRL